MNILITSVGRRAYLVNYFKEAIGKTGEIHAANCYYTLAMEAADNYFLSPLIYDASYISSLIDYCNANSIDAVISLFDIDLLVLAEHAEDFKKNGIRLILAPAKSINICNDKWQTHCFLEEHGIKTPLTFLSIDASLDAIHRGQLAFPLIVKPRWGMSSLGLFCADDEQELRIFYKKSNRVISDSYLKYESSRTPNEQVIIQQFIDGQEYGLDVLNDLDSRYVRTFAKKKLEMRAGETNVGQTTASKPFESIAKQLSTLIQHQGILSVDCLETSDGIYVMEMNCRISGHYPVSHLAGVDFPRQLMRWLSGGDTDPALLTLKENLFVTKALTPRIIDHYQD